MEYLNKLFNGKLDMAIEIFKGDYKKKFLHQLVSGQIDMDRLDYLCRDSFFSGVVEGSVSFDRIIKMLNVAEGNLVVEAKGIYSIEKFLIARRFMYWQVYMHKTVIAGEQLLVNILKRAKTLADEGVELFATPSLKFFLYNHVNKETLFSKSPQYAKEEVLDHFSKLDDNDIISCARVWADHSDFTLSYLCKGIINRHLYKVEINNDPFPQQRIEEMRKKIKLRYSLSDDVMDYFIFTLSISANTYNPEEEEIRIMDKSGRLKDLSDVSEMLKISVLKKTEKKHILCYLRE
jgi:HD superfamily phosphohydrolase